MSEAVKVLKGEYVVRAIEEHRMDKAIIFCRTKVDCDNMEQYLIQKGKGRTNRLIFFSLMRNTLDYFLVDPLNSTYCSQIKLAIG